MAEQIDIKNCSGEGSNCLMAKGHHDLTEFRKAAEAYWGEPLGEHWDGPEHTWLRWVPARPGDDCHGYYHPARPETRGAFEATVMYLY